MKLKIKKEKPPLTYRAGFPYKRIKNSLLHLKDFYQSCYFFFCFRNIKKYHLVDNKCNFYMSNPIKNYNFRNSNNIIVCIYIHTCMHMITNLLIHTYAKRVIKIGTHQ